jgi:hypothetical protein
MKKLSMILLAFITFSACSGEGRMDMLFDDLAAQADSAADITQEDGKIVDLPRSQEVRPDLCAPACQDRECGDDGCGGSCGQCPQVAPICGDDGLCQIQCIPDCESGDKECGDDGCGGDCGSCPQVAPYCVDFKCAVECQAQCQDMECGSDGCGGSCGECGTNDVCLDGTCTCQPQCADLECGDDGCGGQCGTCSGATPNCVGGICVGGCTPECADLECGDDGCDGSCGTCPAGSECLVGLCVDGCEANCQGKECGSDQCGGWCGTCSSGKTCTDAGHCVSQCTPDCSGVECGPNGCGGSCGICAFIEGAFCVAGTCTTECVPDCGSGVCGDDGCGGSCGSCPDPYLCTVAGSCGSYCAQCTYAPGCYDFDFGSGSVGEWAISASQLVGKLGQTMAPSGGYMLKLTTGEGMTELASSATFQNCLPAGDYMALVKWRLYSEEFKEWCGSTYQDSFTIQLATGGNTAVLADYSIDDLCSPADCPGCGQAFTGLVPSDVTFDQGDVWNTPWREDWFPMTLTGNHPIFTLALTLEDAGDGIYDSVVLIDRVRFVPCDEACQYVECGQNPCGENCGECGNGAVCQGGSCCTPDCTGKECGDDGCGGSCGECCQPSCNATPCSDDGCGGICPGTGDITCCVSNDDCDDGDALCTLDICEQGICTFPPSGNPLCCEPFSWLANFDTGQATGFTIANSGQGPLPGMESGWQVSDACGAHSAPYSLYFGMAGGMLGQCLYSIGFPGLGGFSGTATTPSISIPVQGATLTFWIMADILPAEPTEQLTLSVLASNTSSVVWNKSDLNGVGPNWQKATVSLNGYAGKSIKLKFSFETAGTQQAGGKGILIDDISVAGYCGP